MNEERRAHETPGEPGIAPEDLGHPRGTLVIVALFGLLFAAGWLAMYLVRFLGMGAPRP